MSNENLLIALALSCSALFLATTVFIVYFIHTHRKKQVENRNEVNLLHQQFEAAMLQSQIEITEQTLQNISQEIHDNVGQRLSLASIYLNSTNEGDERVVQASKLVETALKDLRNLSRSLNGNYVLQRGIELAIEQEAAIIDASGKMQCTFSSNGEKHNLSEQQEVILFRCVQEALNNAVKHSGATHLRIDMNQTQELTSIAIMDNGKGIPTSPNKGLGFQSIRQRIALLQGNFSLDTQTNVGTTIQFTINTPK